MMHAIFNLPSKVNSFRDMDSYSSVKEGIDLMKTAGVINHNIQATEMLLSNPALMNNHQNDLQAAVLTLLESKESSAAIYVCPPLAITLLKVQKTSNRGFLCIVDTHSVPQALGGNDKGILLATEFDETTKNSKCSLVCEWLKKRTSFYGIPEETRQSLMKIESDEPALADFEWDEWDESEIEDVLNDTLTKYGQVKEETEEEKVTNTAKQDVSEVTSEAPPTKPARDTFETKPSDMEETLWRGYATQLGVTNLKSFQMEAIKAFSMGQDCLIIQPTSSGKSVCFQVPALMNKDKFVLVISPTISLMESQVKSLRQKGVDAAYIGAGPCAPENFNRLMNNVGNQDFPKLVYCTPEYLMGVDGKNGVAHSMLAVSRHIALIAIDECHMIFQRSGEFR